MYKDVFSTAAILADSKPIILNESLTNFVFNYNIQLLRFKTFVWYFLKLQIFSIKYDI